MTYKIFYTDRAITEIRETMEWWRDHRSPEQATRWINELFPAVDTLRSDPERFPFAPESDLYPAGLRQLLFGVGRSITHRVVFTIRESEVWILAVRHAARGSIRSEDLL